MNKNYTITHAHFDKGSVGDSILDTESFVEKIKSLNMTSACITDHGSLSNMYNFYYTCIDNDIKPIIGCEVYIVNDRLIKDKDHKKNYHLILLAKSETGIHNLLNVVSNASLEGKYYKPRTDLDYLSKHNEGLICTTACVGGYAPQLILNNEIDKAKEYINKLKEIFKDDLYLEIQPGRFEDQTKVNLQMINLSKELNVELVAANDVHYLNKDDWKVHDFHIRITRDLKAPENPEDSIYADKMYYTMTYDELLNSFDKDLYSLDTIKKAIENTNVIANKCELTEIKTDKLNLPEFECPDDMTPKEYLESLCIDRLVEIQYKLKNPSQYISRLYYELDVIDTLGFSSYFLIMRDIYDAVRAKGYLIGPGRGSVCGSLTAFLLKLTKVDPIRYNLMFERFLSYERKGSVPDID